MAKFLCLQTGLNQSPPTIPLSIFKRYVNMIVSSKCSQKKVFNSVIIFNPVYMMNKFCGFQIPAKFLFHCKATTLNITSIIIGVIGRVYKNISPFINYATFPARCFISNHKFSGNFLRMSFNISFPISALNKFLSTATQASFFYHSWFFNHIKYSTTKGVIWQ